MCTFMLATIDKYVNTFLFCYHITYIINYTERCVNVVINYNSGSNYFILQFNELF